MSELPSKTAENTVEGTETDAPIRFRREVRDKLGVAHHSANDPIRLRRTIALQQCEDFLCELHESEVAAAEARASQAERDEAPRFIDGYDVAFWHESYHLLRAAIVEHLDGVIHDTDEAEEAILVSAIEKAGKQLEAAEARADLLQRERVSASVSEIREGEDNTGELDSVDLYVAGRGISLLVNVTAQTREVTYSLGVNGVHQQAATILGPLHATPHGGTDREVMQQIVQILGPVTCHCAGCMLEIQKVKELLRTRGIEWTDLPQTKKEKTDEQ